MYMYWLYYSTWGVQTRGVQLLSAASLCTVH